MLHAFRCFTLTTAGDNSITAGDNERVAFAVHHDSIMQAISTEQLDSVVGGTSDRTSQTIGHGLVGAFYGAMGGAAAGAAVWGLSAAGAAAIASGPAAPLTVAPAGLIGAGIGALAGGIAGGVRGYLGANGEGQR
jgi:hypothetical protein